MSLRSFFWLKNKILDTSLENDKIQMYFSKMERCFIMSPRTIPFSFEGKVAAVGVLEQNGKLYMDANTLWEMSGSDVNKDVLSYLCLDNTKALILECFFVDRGIDIHSTSQRASFLKMIGELLDHPMAQQNIAFDMAETDIALSTMSVDMTRNQPMISSKLADEIRAFLSEFQLKRLNPKVESLFVVSTPEDSSGVFLESKIFLDYAMYLSAQLKLHIVSIFQDYAWLEGLRGFDKVEAMLEKAGDVLQEHHTDQTSNRVQRDEVDSRLLLTMKKKTLREKLEDILPPSFYTEDFFFEDVENVLDHAVYEHLFKQSKQKLMSYIDTDTFIDTPHMFLSQDALDVLNRLESEILFYVSQHVNANKKVTKSDLREKIKSFADDLSTKLFRVSSKISLLEFIDKKGNKILVELRKDFSARKKSIKP